MLWYYRNMLQLKIRQSYFKLCYHICALRSPLLKKLKKNHLLSRFPGSVQVRPQGMKLCLIYLLMLEGQLKEQELHPQILKDLFKLREDGENEEKADVP